MHTNIKKHEGCTHLHKWHQKSLTTLQDANKKDSKGKKSNGHIIKYLSIEKGQAEEGKYSALGHDAYSYAWSECHALEPNIFPFSPLTKSLTTNNSTTRLQIFVILSFFLKSQSLTLVKNQFHHLSLWNKISPKIP